jgi:hypothetical protein
MLDAQTTTETQPEELAADDLSPNRAAESESTEQPSVDQTQDPLDEGNVFEHAPLDLNSHSIRLVRIRPAQTSEDRIQCDIRTASVHDEYTCLSYEWGDTENDRYILLDGKEIRTHQNLCNFLSSARQLPQLLSQWIWIDALCIDQSNLVERQHQVHQMGQIYAGAQEVISWLGDKKYIADFLREVPTGRWTAENMWSFSFSPYWGRAWITQEIILGRRLKIMAGQHILSFDQLPQVQSATSDTTIRYNRVLERIKSLRDRMQHSGGLGNALIPLLDEFRWQQCSLHRDRAFSLLALCRESAGLRVDYGSSDAVFGAKLLQCCNESFCLCSIHIVGDVLETRLYLGPTIAPMICGELTLPITWSDSDYTTAPEFPDIADDLNWSDNNDFGPTHFPELAETTLNPNELRQRRERPKKTFWDEICARAMPSGVVIYSSCHSALEQSRTYISIDLRTICPRYSGRAIIWIDAVLDCIFYLGYDAHQDLCLWERRPMSSMTLEILEDAQACTVRMSLEFWLRIARVAPQSPAEGQDAVLFRQSCSRVVDRSFGIRKEEGDPPLRLSVDEQFTGELAKYVLDAKPTFEHLRTQGMGGYTLGYGMGSGTHIVQPYPSLCSRELWRARLH